MNGRISRADLVTGARARSAGSLVLGAAALLAALVLFEDGLALLGEAWGLPEYSHGPLIPVLSAILLHRQIARDGGPMEAGAGATAGATALLASLAAALGAAGALSGLAELSVYGIVVLAGACVVALLGWPVAARFWHPVLHLVFMLPLPGLVYYAVTTALQGISSQVGVLFIRLLDIPVVLEGNVIDMGEVKLLVAEACSGLRYMFPILSFSYVLAILYRGPRRAKLLIFAMAVPTAVAVNALRVAAIGIAYGLHGIPPTEGIAHLFEGWAVFVVSIGLVLACAAALSPGGVPALDTDIGSTRAVLGKLARRRHGPWPLRVLAATLAAGALLVTALPERIGRPVERVPFAMVDEQIGAWRLAERLPIAPEIAKSLAADDLFAATFAGPARGGDVEMFLAYYEDQRAGGVHSPEICLPGAGWEIEAIERSAFEGRGGASVPVMRATIRRGPERRAVLYWFDQHGRRTAVDYVAKLLLVWDGMVHGRTDGALVRLVTPIRPGEEPGEAQSRLTDMARALPDALAPHLPPAPGLGAAPVAVAGVSGAAEG